MNVNGSGDGNTEKERLLKMAFGARDRHLRMFIPSLFQSQRKKRPEI